MNHADWMQLIIGLLMTVTNFFAAHQGAQKGVDSSTNNK